MPDPVLALDLGGTKIRAALVHGLEGAADGAGPAVSVDAPRLERVAEVPTPATEGPEAILTAALALADEVRGGDALRAVGVSSAGVVGAGGRITHATSSLRGWAGTDVRTPLARHLEAPVSVLNDVHAHGLGEARCGAGRGRSSLLLLAIGTGIGGCHVLDGAVVAGARGAAGHAGHVPVPEAEGVPCPCGRSGHLEGLASGPGILRLAAALGAGTAAADGRTLAAAAAGGDRAAREAYRRAGRATGRVLGALLNVLDPEVVALSGGVAEVGGAWQEALVEGVALEAMDVVAATPVLPAEAGTHAALLGAATRALDDLTPSPAPGR